MDAPQAEQVVEAYLDEVAAHLPGPSRARASILAELRSGLLDAVDAHHCSGGLAVSQAAAAATGEFGEPRLVASAFGPELVANQARRVSLTLLVTGPLVGLLWFDAARASHIGLHLPPPLDWSGLAFSGRLGVYAVAVVAAIAICAGIFTVASSAIFTMASTGRLSRCVTSSARQVAAGAAIACFGAATADLTILAVLGAWLWTAPGGLPPLPVAVAAVASASRLALAGRAARNSLASLGALA